MVVTADYRLVLFFLSFRFQGSLRVPRRILLKSHSKKHVFRRKRSLSLYEFVALLT